MSIPHYGLAHRSRRPRRESDVRPCGASESAAGALWRLGPAAGRWAGGARDRPGRHSPARRLTPCARRRPGGRGNPPTRATEPWLRTHPRLRRAARTGRDPGGGASPHSETARRRVRRSATQPPDKRSKSRRIAIETPATTRLITTASLERSTMRRRLSERGSQASIRRHWSVFDVICARGSADGLMMRKRWRRGSAQAPNYDG